MKDKFFFTKEFCSCSLNSLDPEKIKLSYTNELKKYDIKRTRYYNLVAKTLGFQDWTKYIKAYDEEIISFLEKNNLIKYAPDSNLNILEAEHDLNFTYRQVADRLFYNNNPYPKKIFTAYKCTTDNFAYHCPTPNHFYDIDIHISSFNDLSKYRTKDGLNKLEIQKSILQSDKYKNIKEECNLDYLIPMDLVRFSTYHNLLSDLFVINDKEIQDKYVFCMYDNYEGITNQDEYIKIAKLLKEHLLTIKKGWIDIIPFNDNLIFLKAEDGTYDFVFKNLREDKFQSPYSNYIKHEYIPTTLNEAYDFERWLYYGFKETHTNFKEIMPHQFWKEKDEHLSEVYFYENNEAKNYPGRSTILKDFYIDKGFYSYEKKTTNKTINGLNRVELKNKILYVSELITIKDFFDFYNNEYKEKRSDSLDEIFTNNIENENLPVSVTWYDAIAYCRYLEKKYNVPFRLIAPDEFQEICPSSNRSEKENPYQLNVKSELEFYQENNLLNSPPSYMPDFDTVIMKYKKELNFISKQNINFCIDTTFKEWSNYFRNGYSAALSARYPEIEVNQENRAYYSFQANLNYKYKYLKMGFRICYELSEEQL